MQLMVEVPGDVLTSPHLDDPTLDLSKWDGVGVPAGLVLRWLDDVPLTDGTIALLAQIPADELAPSDLPLLVKAWDRAESHCAARKAAAVAQLTDVTRDFRGWDDDDPAPNEVSLACRIPLGAAQHEVHRAQRLRAVLPGTRRLFDDGRITARHVAKIVAATTTLTPEQCAKVEELALPDAETLSVNEFAFRVRRAVAQVDPKDFDRRHREARLHADVTVDVVDEANAMAWLSAYLPAPQAILIREKVEAHARAVKAAGDKRPLGVLRAEAPSPRGALRPRPPHPPPRRADQREQPRPVRTTVAQQQNPTNGHRHRQTRRLSAMDNTARTVSRRQTVRLPARSLSERQRGN